MEEVRYLKTIKERLQGKKVCIFPMGVGGKDMRDKLSSRGIHIDFFCDNNEAVWNDDYHGTTCIPYPQLLEMNPEEVVVIIESSSWYDAIKAQLCQDGFHDCMRIYFEKIFAEEYIQECTDDITGKIERVIGILDDERSREVYRRLTEFWTMTDIPDDYFREICSENQYFDEEIIHLDEHEVFVDCGAYIGDSAMDFMRESHGKYRKMHLFELDPDIYKELLSNAAKMQRDSDGIIQCYPYGVSNKNQEITFISGERNSSIDSSIAAANGKSKERSGKIRVLDDMLADEEVTFIKMDIEGAEHDALDGARKIITAQKPILAICIYHSPKDMLELPVFIKSLYPEYRIYIRHYTEVMFETVCYAIPSHMT